MTSLIICLKSKKSPYNQYDMQWIGQGQAPQRVPGELQGGEPERMRCRQKANIFARPSALLDA
jgi:hypothetical protein